jgi:hypothetical protein
MIDIKTLTEQDKGRYVIYQTAYIKQTGILKSYNDSIIFVVYHYNNDPDNYRDYTGAATRPEDLTFLEGVEGVKNE